MKIIDWLIGVGLMVTGSYLVANDIQAWGVAIVASGGYLLGTTFGNKN